MNPLQRYFKSHISESNVKASLNHAVKFLSYVIVTGCYSYTLVHILKNKCSLSTFSFYRHFDSLIIPRVCT